jgi:hypothetical protein
MTALVKIKRAVLVLFGLEQGPFSLTQNDVGETSVSVAPEEGLTFEESEKRLEEKKRLMELDRDTMKAAVETRELGDRLILGSLEDLARMQSAANTVVEQQIRGEILVASRPTLIATGVLAANTENLQEQEANEKAQRSLERTKFENTQSRLGDAAQHIDSLGPAEKEQQQSEEDRRLQKWALDLADDAARMAHALNEKYLPVTETDRYYAYAAVQYYASVRDGKSRDEAIQVASTKLFDLRKRQQEISDDEAHQLARRANGLHAEIGRKAKEAEKAELTRVELEASRNNLQAAEKQHAAVDKLEAIIQGRKSDGTNFDPRA